MRELTELRICKRIAEIEGKYTKAKDHFVCSRGLLYFGYGAGHTEYNPLMNDALCFQLMVKYGVTVSFVENEAYVYNDYKTRSICFDGDLSPNKAICLAIIEAHKE